MENDRYQNEINSSKCRDISLKSKNAIEFITRLARLPILCNKCGCISQMKEISDVLDLYDNFQVIDFDQLQDQLIRKSELIVEQRQQKIKEAKQELQQSIQQFMQVRQSMGFTLNFDNKDKCLLRVCEDIYSNIQEQFEIQNSLGELNQIISEQQQYAKKHYTPQDISQEEYQDHIEIRDRLEGALRINQSHKEILKEILLKIGEENKHYTFDVQLQMRQQQLETLNLLQTNQDQLQIIQILQDELADKKNELMKFSMFSNQENPFKTNKLHSQTDDSSSQYQSIQQDQHNHNSQSSQRHVFQDIKNTHQKKNTTQQENLCTFQSEQFYSLDQSNTSQQHQEVSQKSSQKSSQNSKQFENSVIINQRYNNSQSNKFSNSKASSIISQLQIPQQVMIGNHSSRGIKSSLDTNPMASQESVDENDHENSPQITPSSKTLLAKVPTISKGRLLVLD